jgi:hypothetical protein
MGSCSRGSRPLGRETVPRTLPLEPWTGGRSQSPRSSLETKSARIPADRSQPAQRGRHRRTLSEAIPTRLRRCRALPGETMKDCRGGTREPVKAPAIQAYPFLSLRLPRVTPPGAVSSKKSKFRPRFSGSADSKRPWDLATKDTRSQRRCVQSYSMAFCKQKSRRNNPSVAHHRSY